jgi:hypothetical protein
MYEYDSGLALLHLGRRAALYRMEDKVSGVRLKLDDLFAAPRVARELGQPDRGRRLRHRLDPQPRQLLPRRADREARDVHHPHADRRGGRVQHRVDAGDGGDRQAADIAILRTLGASPRRS